MSKRSAGEGGAHRCHERTLLGLRADAHARELRRPARAARPRRDRRDPRGSARRPGSSCRRCPAIARSALGSSAAAPARARGCRVRRRAHVARQKFIIPVPSPRLDIRAQMQADLKEAMKAHDSSRVAVLRATLGALANAEAVEPPRGPISLDRGSGDDRGRSARAVRCRGAFDHRARASRAARRSGRTRGARTARRRGRAPLQASIIDAYLDR